MAAIRKNDFEKLGRKEMEAKIKEFEKAILELEGEGKRDKARPLKKAIASLKTRLHSSAVTLNTSAGIEKNTKKPARDAGKKVNEQK